MKSILVAWICCYYYLAGSVGACSDDNHNHRHLRSEDTTTNNNNKNDPEPARDLQWLEAVAVQNTTFRVGSYQWSTFKDFLQSGARCQTADLSVTEQELDRLAVSSLRIAGLVGGQLRTETITVSVYWHKIRSSSGGGSVSSQKITDSLNVLNTAFAAAGFQFVLTRTDETTNDSWYKAQAGSSASNEMKAALHQGTMAALNVYTSSPDGGILGFATLPSSKQGAKDGVVILYSTVPGGSAAPYNKGATLVHEVRVIIRDSLVACWCSVQLLDVEDCCAWIDSIPTLVLKFRLDIGLE